MDVMAVGTRSEKISLRRCLGAETCVLKMKHPLGGGGELQVEGAAAKALRLEPVGLLEEKENTCGWCSFRERGGRGWDGRGRQRMDGVGLCRKDNGECGAGVSCDWICVLRTGLRGKKCLLGEQERKGEQYEADE